MVALLLERTLFPLYQAAINRESMQTQSAVDGLENIIEQLHVKVRGLAYQISENEFITNGISEVNSINVIELVNDMSGLYGVDFLEFVDLEDQIIFSLPFYDDRAGESVKHWPIYSQTTRSREVSSLENFDGVIYLLATKFIFHNGEHVGTLIAGIEINETMINDWSKQLTTHISLVVNGNNIFTSLYIDAKPFFLEVNQDQKMVEINNEPYLTRKMKIRSVNHQVDAYFVVAKSMDIFFQSVQTVVFDIGLYVVPLLLISLFVIFFIGKYITKVSSSLKDLNLSLEKKNQDLLKLDKIKDEFLANTSHELKTPLHGIIGLTDSLINGVAGKLNSKTIKNLRLISHSGQRLNNLVNDILDFSKLKHRKITLSRQIIDLTSIINTVISFSEKTLRGKDLKIINGLPDDLPLVFADENRLQQILYNLLGNAIKFTSKGSIELKSEVDNRCVTIFISDTGIGIEPNKIESIFDSFEQADGSISREYGGTGLGLSISRRLVELHGGQLKVNSEQGRGSTFYFSIPIASEKELKEHEKNEKPSIFSEVASKNIENQSTSVNTSNTTIVGHQNIAKIAENLSHADKTILVVDDEYVNVEVIKNLLQLVNYKAIFAYNGQDALKLIFESKPDLVLLDLMMPRMTGIEVCVKVREKFNKVELPIIMLTAKNNENELINCLKNGANDYLIKPCSGDVLVARLETQLSLKESLEKLEQYNLNLEKTIAERTKKLSQYVRKVHTIMETIPLGILIIGKERKIQQEFSRRSIEILQTEKIADQSIDILLNESSLSADNKNLTISCLEACLGEGEINWKINHKLMPQELIFKGNQILELTWSPIVAKGMIEGFILVVNNVTKRRKLETIATSNKKEMQIVAELIKLPRGKFDTFNEIASSYIADSKTILSSQKDIDFCALLRNLHSIKGLARYSDLSFMVDVTHYAEKFFEEKINDRDLNKSDLINELHRVEEILRKYIESSALFYKPDESSKYYRFYKKVETLGKNKFEPEQFRKQITRALDQIENMSIAEIFFELKTMIESLSEELKCDVPNIDVSGYQQYLSNQDVVLFENIFIQLIRNTLSHGQKNHIGITISQEIKGDNFVVNYRDNGKGLNMAEILKVGLKRNLIKPEATDEEVANLIFSSGFSTKRDVDKVSGRGIGISSC